MSDFNKIWIFSTYFQKTEVPNLLKIHPVTAELLHANGRADGERQTRNDVANRRCPQFCESA